MATVTEVENLSIRKSDDLCKLAELLGYKDKTFNQLQCNNGAYVSSLLSMLDDNPGLLETIKKWVQENMNLQVVDSFSAHFIAVLERMQKEQGSLEPIWITKDEFVVAVIQHMNPHPDDIPGLTQELLNYIEIDLSDDDGYLDENNDFKVSLREKTT